MARYWKLEDHTFGTSGDDVDLSELDARASELTEQEWADQTAALSAASVRVPVPPVVTSLAGNNTTHSTNGDASVVTVHVLAPAGGPVRARPTINGAPISAGQPIILSRPGVVTVTTRAGNNDVVIVEEF